MRGVFPPGAKLEITPSMGLGRTGISFATPDELEAAGITWLEVNYSPEHDIKSPAPSL